MRISACFGVLAAFLALTAFDTALVAAEPAVAYETTVPGYYLASGHGMAVDGEGNAYFIGKAYENQVQLDIVVMKLDPVGTPVWTRYIVGDNHDWAADIALDKSGDVYLTGWTDSGDFPIVNGMDDALTGFREAFVMKLSRFDGSIVFSTFLGGDYTDEGAGIMLNDAGEIIVAGTTGSTDFPTTTDAYQAEPSAPLYIYTDLFVTRLSPGGDTILYSTYLGGFKDDQAVSADLDASGDVIIAGWTTATDFPLVNPYQSEPHEIFVTKLSADGSALLFGTYFGGSDVDRLGGMAAGPDGNVYLTGSTRSVDFPVTAGAFQTEFAGEIGGCGSGSYDPIHNCEDAFVAKLGTDGSGLAYGSYLGGGSIDEGGGIAVDEGGCALVIGNTTSTDFPGSEEMSGSIFVSRIGPAGSELFYSYTKPSGSANAGHGIATGSATEVYFTGAINVPADFYVAKIVGASAIVTSVSDGPVALPATRLFEPRPNPFNPAASIRFTIDEAAPVKLAIYDPAGRLVTTLADGHFNAGEFERIWDGRDGSGRAVSSGVYFARLEAGLSGDTKKMLLVR